MRIEFVEIGNFRKLLSTRVGLSSEKTVFVGANNSGKTSAITALRYFLVDRERSSFCFNDFTLAHWPAINTMGATWEAAHKESQPLPESEWNSVLPFLDVWLQVAWPGRELGPHRRRAFGLAVRFALGVGLGLHPRQLAAHLVELTG